MAAGSGLACDCIACEDKVPDASSARLDLVKNVELHKRMKNAPVLEAGSGREVGTVRIQGL